jgi:hypothetical protein
MATSRNTVKYTEWRPDHPKKPPADIFRWTLENA